MLRFIFILVLIILIILAFTGVQPISDWKDSAFTSVSNWWHDLVEKTDNATETGTITTGTTTLAISVTSPSRTTSQYTVLNDFVTIFNDYRRSQGLGPLIFTDDLNRVAELRLAELKTDFSHYSRGGYNLHLGENIVEGVYSNEAAFYCWQGSPGHNANMLDSEYVYTGYAIGGGYAVQVFSEYTTINGVPQLPPGWYWSD
jgi:uncharacterized protein YkwD